MVRLATGTELVFPSRANRALEKLRKSLSRTKLLLLAAREGICKSFVTQGISGQCLKFSLPVNQICSKGIGVQGMKDNNLSRTTLSQTSTEPTASSNNEEVQRHWQGVVQRRSFLKSIGLAGAALSASVVLGRDSLAQESHRRTGKLPKGDAALLRFAAAVELIEADLWQQYNELGGVQGGNPAYIAALSNLDGDMPQYIADNTDDELSHAAFLKMPTDIQRRGTRRSGDAFRTLPSSQASGAKNIGRLTNLMRLNVDLSWYNVAPQREEPRLRSEVERPIHDPQRARNTTQRHRHTAGSSTTSPSSHTPGGSHAGNCKHGRVPFCFYRARWCEPLPHAGFQGDGSRGAAILVSIGGVEIDHFGLWHDKAGNAVAQPLAGVTDPQTGLTFPDLNALNSELDQTNLILAEPCTFISKNLPECSVIRPTTTEHGGAVEPSRRYARTCFPRATDRVLDLVDRLAVEADSVAEGTLNPSTAFV